MKIRNGKNGNVQLPYFPYTSSIPTLGLKDLCKSESSLNKEKLSPGSDKPTGSARK